jgi:hypothetical protein
VKAEIALIRRLPGDPGTRHVNPHLPQVLA